MKIFKKSLAVVLSFVMLGLAACDGTQGSEETSAADTSATETSTDITSNTEPAGTDPVESNGEVCILFTSDVHCGIDDGFGYAGLYQIKQNLEAQGYDTILVDDGDSIQGESVGTLSKGEYIIDLMNDIGYDVAIPGNHEFDYGMDRFLELTGMAEFPYISCNLSREGELVFEPYTIIESCGMKIAFVGMTTPTTFTSSTPEYFQDDQGNFIYDFKQERTGEAFYQAVQDAVDQAREEGADYVIAMAHLGNESTNEPWTYGDVISHTRGIDIFLDGHSHDTDIIPVNNLDGEEVTRYAVGTKLTSIGYIMISPEDGVTDAGMWNWANDSSVAELFALDNMMAEKVDQVYAELSATLDEVVATSQVDLILNDPNEIDLNGKPIRIIRLCETNLGDLCADAIRVESGADISIINGGSVRAEIRSGDITYGNIIDVHPYGNQICMIEATGAQILDALEWGARSLPEQNGAFLQVSGMSFTIDVNVPSGCQADENGYCTGITGARRVKDVMIGDSPLDPNATYTVAGFDYLLMKNGDGYTCFNGCNVISDGLMLDNQATINYLTEELGGVIGADYEDIYGQGRITIIQ